MSAANASIEVVQTFLSLPEGARNPQLWYPLGALASGAATLGSSIIYDHKPERPGIQGADPVLLKQARDGVRALPKWHRLAPPLISAAGLIFAGANHFSSPYVESTVIAANSHDVVDLDASLPMVDTGDMTGGASRFDAALSSMKDVRQNISFGVVEFGASAINVANPSANQAVFDRLLNVKKVAANGEDVDDSLNNNAENMLNPETGSENNLRYAGKVILITDGVSLGANLSADVKTLKEEGISVEAIVMGSHPADYYTNTGAGPFHSGSNETAVSQSIADVKSVGTDSNQLTKDLKQAIEGQNTTESQSSWVWPNVLAYGAVIGGLAWDLLQRTKRKIG